MNKIKLINQINQKELKSHNLTYKSSWHYDYRDTNYIYIGNIPQTIKYKDIIIIFSQYGIPTHLNLIINKETGKHRGFAFLKYSNFKSCILAIDNFNGIKINSNMLIVDHNYYKLHYNEKEDDYLINYDEIRKEIENGKLKEEVEEKNQKLITSNEESIEQEKDKIEFENEDEFKDPMENVNNNNEDDEFVDPMESFIKSKSKEKSHKSRHHRSNRHKSKSHKSSTSRREEDTIEDRVREKSPERESES
ncbi:hypothetical protein KGF54_002768 [Candida jiufengensis]|uniref:uncharacterized protein n=1 Tax=Candida jiufengensis TaxID=497108 RepID=UPI0022259293|nr:uncharacterized protein KGF54_002768 [Candida jiufengensis]KAI5953396.1 hypothetical protein KGF54_002768 [Candida jiufengensis]